MTRTAARVFFASLVILACACSRPPKGMRRLDSGDSNHEFRVDARLRRLYYIEGGDDRLTRLGVVDLETGRRESYRFPHRRLVALKASATADEVTIAAENTEVEPNESYSLMQVEADTGRVLREEGLDEIDRRDFLAFTGPVSGTRLIGGFRPGVLTAGRFFPTESPPENLVMGPGARVYASDQTGDSWKVEEFDGRTGTRRVLAEFPGQVESMARAGLGLAVFHRHAGEDGPRRLAMIDAVNASVDIEVPWLDGDSEILSADSGKRLLYVRMNEADNQTCWAVHFDKKALEAASAYLAKDRGPTVPRMTSTDWLGLVVVVGMLVSIAGLIAARDA